MTNLLIDMAAIVGHEMALDILGRLQCMGGRVYRIGSEATRAADTQKAMRLLNAGLSRAEVRAILVDGGLTRRTAYNRINEAINLRRAMSPTRYG